MKCIVIGLGSFGGSLAKSLTELGNEVIGIDIKMEKVEALKDSISHAICMDTTDQNTMIGLPIKDTDIFVVAIGEDAGANIMTTVVLKELNAKHIVSRAINPIHNSVLQAVGVTEIIHPEKDAALRWAKKLVLKGVEEVFEISGNYSIVEVRVPEKYDGKTVAEVGFRRNFNLVVLTTIEEKNTKNLIGTVYKSSEAQGVASYDTIIYKNDIIVVYGYNKDIEKFLKS